MSDETEVERLLENFQKALDTLNNIGNVEALITKLDANKNRKLLKKVKHVVGEVHNKVGTVKEKVSKAYKRVKLLSSSESEDVPLPANADKEVGHKDTNCLDQGENILRNIDDAGRDSPILGGKEKYLKRAARQIAKSQKNRKEQISGLESPGNASDEQSKEGVSENEDIIMKDKESSVEEMGQRMDVDTEADNAINSDDSETQIEANVIEETEKSNDIENEEKDTEGENSQDVVEGTPEKPVTNLSLSLRRNRDTTKEKTVVKDYVDKDTNKSKKLNQGEDNEYEQEDSDSKTKISRSRRQKNKLKNTSDSEEQNKTSRKLRGRRNKKKESDVSDEDEDKLEKSSRKSKHTEKPTSGSDSEEETTHSIRKRDKEKISSDIENKSNSEIEISKSNRKKDKTSEDKGLNSSDSDDGFLSELCDKINKKKDKGSDISDFEEENLKENKGKYCSKTSINSKTIEKPKNASDSDEEERIEEDESKCETETSRSNKNNVETSEDNEKSGSNSDEDCILKVPDKVDKNNASDGDETKKMDKDDKHSDTSNDEEDKIEEQLKDASRDKTSKETTNASSDGDEAEQMVETTEKSSEDEASKHSDNDTDHDRNMSTDEKDKNKTNSCQVSNDSIVIIEDTPKKGSENDKDRNEGKDSSHDETDDKTTENSVETEDKDDHPPIPKIKLVDINKLLAPNKKPLEVMTPSPKAKKCVTFDSSVIILSSSDEETPKKDPKNKDQSPLKSAMRKSALREEADNSDSDTKENNENLRNRRTKRRTKTENKILTSDRSSDESDDSDFQESRRSRRLTRHEAKTASLKNKFAKLATKYGERKSRATAARRLRDEEDYSNREESKQKKKKKGTKDKKSNSDSENDSEKDVRSKKRRRKKDILETSSISDQSDHSDMSDFEVTSKRKSGPKSRTGVKKAKVSYPEADPNDPKFKTGVFVRLPLFKCEELPDIYKRKKELFEVKKLTKMDFTRRTRSARNGPVKTSDDSDKPEKKRIKLTLKLNRKTKPKAKEESSDDERSSTEDNKDRDVEKDGAGKEKDKAVLVVPLDEPDCAGANDDVLAEACLEQVKDDSDKEDCDKQNEASDSDEDDDAKKKDKNKKKKNSQKNKKDKDNEDEDSEEENSKKKGKKSDKRDKGQESKVNGTLSDGEEESDENQRDDKDSKDSSSDEGEDGKKKKGKNWKNDKLLKEKIDSSDSDEDFAKFSKKKDKSKSELVRKARKRMKKTTVLSDSDLDEDEDKEKKKGKGSDDDYKEENKSSSESGSGSEKEDNSEESEEENKKPARKRIKRVKDSSSDEDDKSTRKHIRRMIDRDSLSDTTRKAEQEEKLRKGRIAEKQKKYNQIFDLKADATVDKVVLDFDEKTDEPLLSVGKKLARQLKPHQVHGIKFMWDACFESLARLKKNAGSGCILAHCMGLGKTLQVIALSHALLTNSDKTKVEKIMVVCPVNTVLNWKSEFKKWIPRGNEFEVYELVSCKTSYINQERNYIIREWHENGGVLIIGYNMFRTLSNPENKSISKKLRNSFQEGLVDPGPDLVVCDEGHLLKNEKTNLSIAMNRIKTPRRIVLTGTPLQNNLKEYWCMVQFIKPNLLGTYKEYMNRFVNPIINGQYTDSTQHDIVVMRRRSHVLHKLLDGVVQRQDYSVLEPYLPPKYEYVLFLKLTEVQINLYSHYMNHFARRSNDGSNRTSFLFTDFQQLQRICTHPRVLSDKSIEDKERKEQNDESESEGSLKDFIDDDESEAASTSSGSDGSGSNVGSDTSIKSDEKKKKKKDKKATAKRKRVTRAQAAQKREDGNESDSDLEVIGPKEWWQEYIDNDELDNINHSAKIFLLFQILKECEEIGDKILVFSQSLYTLNCIEYFLQRIDEATQNGNTEKVGGHSGSWAIGLDYFRLDGSSSCDNRANWCDQFNDPDNTRARLFLISTKAGGLGINLVAANRVIIFDVSWNPSHDIQSIYRVYRFGQTKPSYVYRFVTYGAMEMKIYERQVTKQAISKRVIDEQQIDRHYSQNDIQELYKTELDPTDRPIPMVPKDVLLGEMLQKYDKTIFKYHEHQSLLENKQDEELNEEERKAAWEEFENEKDLRKTSLTNFSGINLAAFQNQMNFSPQLIQVALANIVRKDNPAWSEVQIRGILPALVTQLQMQMTENDFSMYNRVHQEIRLMQQLQAQRMRERYLQQYQLQQMLQKQQLTNQMLGNLNVTPEELRRLQQAASQNYIQPPPPRSTAGGSGDVIELND